MERLVMSTEDVPEREQFGLWRELGARHLLGVGSERDGPSRAPCRGTMTVQRLGAARLVDLRSEGHRVVAGGAPAARAAADVYIVEQEVGAPSRYTIDRRPIECRSGDLLIHAPDARFEQDGPADWATRI